MPVASPKAAVRIALAVPEDLYDLYAERATKRGVEPQDELLTHLQRTRNWTDSTPIYLDNESRKALSALAGRSLFTAADVVAWAKQTATLTIAGTKVELSTPLRASIDVQRGRIALRDFLPDKAIELFEHWLNLR